MEFAVPDAVKEQQKDYGKRFCIEILKVADYRRDFQVLNHITDAANMYIHSTGMVLLHVRKEDYRMVSIDHHRDFFETYRFTPPTTAAKDSWILGVNIRQWLQKLKICLLDLHVRRLCIQDTPEGYINFTGVNQNGVIANEFLRPMPPVVQRSQLSQLVTNDADNYVRYDYVLELPSKLLQKEVCDRANHSKWITFHFDANSHPAFLQLKSDVRDGLTSKSEPAFLLPPENVIANPLLPRKEKLPSATVTVDTSFLKMLTEAYRQSLVTRVHLCTNQPLVLEFVSMQSSSNPRHDSRLQIWIGPRTEAPHPSVA